jgi:F420-dependent oxidoreductase-like protein
MPQSTRRISSRECEKKVEVDGMKLGLVALSYADGRLDVERVLEAERLGYDCVWSAEAYGADAVTPLAYLAARTTRIRLGTGILQLAGRSPANCAMTMSTLDILSGGRVIVGLGLSGPQVVEGWHGVPYRSPSRWLREYVQILRAIWAREAPVEFEGEIYQLPYHGPGATGLGKPLRSTLHPRQLPIYLAAMGPLNVRLTAEIADGWLPIWLSPYKPEIYRPILEEGFKRAGGGKSWKDFDIAARCHVQIGDDVGACLASLKPRFALYIGGMGAREKNFYNDLACKLGYVDAAARIQDLYLAGRKDEATAAVPDELCDELSLCGPESRIRERFPVWEQAGVTTMIVDSNQPEAFELMAQIIIPSPSGRER